MSELWKGIITILTAVIGVAILATLVSKQANTAGVINAGASGFAKILGAATSPLGGGIGNAGYNSLY